MLVDRDFRAGGEILDVEIGLAARVIRPCKVVAIGRHGGSKRDRAGIGELHDILSVEVAHVHLFVPGAVGDEDDSGAEDGALAGEQFDQIGAKTQAYCPKLALLAGVVAMEQRLAGSIVHVHFKNRLARPLRHASARINIAANRSDRRKIERAALGVSDVERSRHQIEQAGEIESPLDGGVETAGPCGLPVPFGDGFIEDNGDPAGARFPDSDVFANLFGFEQQRHEQQAEQREAKRGK